VIDGDKRKRQNEKRFPYNPTRTPLLPKKANFVSFILSLMDFSFFCFLKNIMDHSQTSTCPQGVNYALSMPLIGRSGCWAFVLSLVS
jgi:hypothetical protein